MERNINIILPCYLQLVETKHIYSNFFLIIDHRIIFPFFWNWDIALKKYLVSKQIILHL